MKGKFKERSHNSDVMSAWTPHRNPKHFLQILADLKMKVHGGDEPDGGLKPGIRPIGRN